MTLNRLSAAAQTLLLSRPSMNAKAFDQLDKAEGLGRYYLRPKEQTAVKFEDDLEEQGLQFVFRFEQ